MVYLSPLIVSFLPIITLLYATPELCNYTGCRSGISFVLQAIVSVEFHDGTWLRVWSHGAYNLRLPIVLTAVAPATVTLPICSVMNSSFRGE
jgi:hypothetical protein